MSTKPDNKLRVFENEDDLLDNNDNATILTWVNAYAKSIEARKGYQKKNQAVKRMLLKYAKRNLDKDELETIEAVAERQAAQQLGKAEAEDDGGLPTV
jgi:beta-glucosidase-like glycosyl hydrolase